MSRYKIVYYGALKAGTDPEQFVQRFMEVFKAPEANARKLVDLGHPVTLKTRLDQAQAEKMREAMDTLGMQVRVEVMTGEGEMAGTPAPARNAAAAPAAPEPQGPRCPKCGSTRVSGDDCLACGVIISRYKEKQARLAAEAAANPYAPPQSDVEVTEQTSLGNPRRVPIGNAWRWFGAAWGHFRQNPLAWIGAQLCLIVLMLGMSLVPFVGSLASNILGPVFLAGFMLGADEQREGGDFEVRHLFAAFSGHTGSLALVGLLYLVGLIAIVMVAAMVFGGGLVAMIMNGGGEGIQPETMSPDAMGSFVIALVGFVLLVLALMIPLLMAYWFAPALVVLGGMGPVEAMKMSFKACLKNTLPFLFYGLLGLILVVVAFIPLGLGLLILIPVVTATIFTAYRDIFYAPAPEEA